MIFCVLHKKNYKLELLGMSDRIVVIAEGQLTGTLSQGQFSQQTILELASVSAYRKERYHESI